MDEVFRVRSDVAHAVRHTGDFRIRTPVGDGLILPGQRGDRIALRILAHHLDDFAEIPLGHHLLGQLDHRVAGVVVSQRKDLFALLDNFTQFTGLLESVSDRLVADDIDAGLQESLGHVKMQVVLHDDTNEINALICRQRRLGLSHLLIAAVHARRVEMKVPARLL